MLRETGRGPSPLRGRLPSTLRKVLVSTHCPDRETEGWVGEKRREREGEKEGGMGWGWGGTGGEGKGRERWAPRTRILFEGPAHICAGCWGWGRGVVTAALGAPRGRREPVCGHSWVGAGLSGSADPPPNPRLFKPVLASSLPPTPLMTRHLTRAQSPHSGKQLP